MSEAKPFPITKRQVWEAYKRVNANQGGAGVDGQSLAEFAEDLENNLYKLWNRLASGSYMPPPVRRVEIPKAGGVRPLGIPTVADRIAQTVLKQALEPELENHFHPDSYGYRPDKSAHQATAAARQRCWRNDWVVDLDHAITHISVGPETTRAGHSGRRLLRCCPITRDGASADGRVDSEPAVRAGV
jgi:retron-type reverse transcriptase